MELHDLMEKYGSDKNLSSYTPIYQLIFKEYRDQPISLLEIGIGTLLPEIPSTFCGNIRLYPDYKPGGSLRVWRDYFSKGQIYGGDVAEDCMFSEERITTLLFDSTNKEDSDRKLGGLSFNIIVDDGLHTKEAQLSTITNLWNRLRNGGIYVIEDIMYPDHFRKHVLPEIRYLVQDADICPNCRGNMTYIKKYK